MIVNAGYWYAPDDYQADNGTMQGSAHSVSAETAEETPVDRLHATIAEVTGKEVAKPTKPHIGFYD